MERHGAFDEELEHTVLDVGIPPCPTILLELAFEARKEETDLHRIEKLISSDVGLSAALIKTVNSPFYGLRIKVHAIAHAIQVLGLNRLWLMVMGMVLRDTLRDMCQVDMRRFWDASAKVATISSYIALRLPGLDSKTPRPVIDKDEAYTYGLFQDCGIPILLSHYPRYKETLSMANHMQERKFTDIEEAGHNTNHALVGYLLAKSWGLPEDMVQAIRNHHEHEDIAGGDEMISAASRNFIALALLAEHAIQDITGLSLGCEWNKGGQWVCRHFGLSDEDVQVIIDGIRVLYEEGNLEDL
ncbi:MAG TPA: HDOD domain-containing protein [Gallionellaceae bacterium]|nr:HDOD domain-containing protein [Gallionellaceae bacterium]